MSKINRVPRGLQTLLGNTAAGTNPDVLGTIVQPTVDLTPYWDNERIQFEVQTKSITGVTSAIFFPIPEGEQWIPLQIGASIDGFLSGEECRLSCRVYSSGGVFDNTLPLAVTETITFASAPEEMCIGYSWPQRTVYSSGRVFSVNVDKFTGAAVRILRAGILYVRL